MIQNAERNYVSGLAGNEGPAKSTKLLLAHNLGKCAMNTLEVEIIGKANALEASKKELSSISQSEIEEYEHKGFAGEAGLIGVIIKLLPTAMEALFQILKPLIVKEGTITIKVNGNEFIVRDVKEFNIILNELSARGLIATSGQK